MHDWDEIRRKHGPMVWNVIGRILRNSEDITDCYQDVFLEAFQRSRTRDINHMPGLLRWLAVHRALDSLRKLKVQSKFATSGNIDEITCDRAHETLRVNELLESVRCALTSLPLEQSECFWLCCVEGLKYREAAEAMGLETQHVGVLIQRARKHLSKALIDWQHARTV